MAWRPETAAAQGVSGPDPETGGVVPPIQPSSTYVRGADGEGVAGYSYQRDETPTGRPAEALLARLEGGDDALLFSSGMAGASAVIRSLKPGDHVVGQTVMYWGFRRWLAEFCAEWGIGLDLVEPDADAIADAIRPGETALVWIETPANPTWEVVDIARAAEAAHAAGAWLVADNTVATPVHTRPLDFGADIVFHSASKALNGHSDVIAGALVTNVPDSAFWCRIRRTRQQGGAILGPFEAWLLFRGMRTLHVRMERASDNAARIAGGLANHPAIAEVQYPGLAAHPGHAVAAHQMTGGFSTMLSLRLAGGADAAARMAAACEVFVHATSLGGVESLIEHRKPHEGPESATPDDLVRLSVGIEHPADLLADLNRALDAG